MDGRRVQVQEDWREELRPGRLQLASLRMSTVHPERGQLTVVLDARAPPVARDAEAVAAWAAAGSVAVAITIDPNPIRGVLA